MMQCNSFSVEAWTIAKKEKTKITIYKNLHTNCTLWLSFYSFSCPLLLLNRSNDETGGAELGLGWCFFRAILTG